MIEKARPTILDPTNKDRKAFSHALLKHSADLILILNAEGVIGYESPATPKMLGYNPEQLYGESFSELIHPQDLSTFTTEFQAVLQTPALTTSLELNVQHQNGTWYVFKCVLKNLLNDPEIAGIVIYSHDITERKRVEQALEQVEARYRYLFDEAPAMYIITHDYGGTPLIIDCNERCLNTLGYQWAELQNQPLTNIYTKKSREAWLNSDSYQRTLAGEVVIEEQALVTRDRQVIQTMLQATPETDTNGVVVGTLAMYIDISEQKTLQARNAQLYAEAKRRAEQLAILHELDQAITASLHIDDVYETTAKYTARLIPYDHLSVTLLEGEKAQVTYIVGSKVMQKALGLMLPLTTSGIGQVVTEGVPLIRKDRTDVHLPEDKLLLARDNIQATMFIPLRVKGQLIGSWNLGSRHVGIYTADEQLIAQSIADQLAIAIENARLHAEAERRAKQLSVLHELDRAITASTHINDVYRAFARHTIRLIPYDHLSILLLHETHIQIAYIVDEETPQEKELPLNEQESIVQWMFKASRPSLRQNKNNTRRFSEDGTLFSSQLQSLLHFPLRIKRVVVGTCNLGCEQAEIYGADDLQIGQAMADQLATAIENAQLYDSLQNQMEVLQRTQNQLVQSEKMAALGRLSAAIAHEINNPLQAIQNAMILFKQDQAKRDNNKDNDLDYSTEIIEMEIERIANLVRHMRNFYQPLDKQGQVSVSNVDAISHFYQSPEREMHVIDIPPMLQDILQLLAQQMAQYKIIVKFEAMDDLPSIRGNPDHLKQVFLNLILNALEAMEGQGGTLHVYLSSSQIQLTSYHSDPALRLDFNDTGVGIPPEALPRLFEPFFSTKSQGSGLGLFISYKIIEAHLGQINVESQVGLGTTFSIFLPAI